MTGHSAGRASEIDIERDGKIVRFLMKCNSEYDAMMLYDRMTEELRNGGVKLEIQCKPRVDTELG